MDSGVETAFVDVDDPEVEAVVSATELVAVGAVVAEEVGIPVMLLTTVGTGVVVASGTGVIAIDST